MNSRFINRNLSGYLVPANADIPELHVLFVGEFDEEAGLLGTKGLGELTAVSVARDRERDPPRNGKENSRFAGNRGKALLEES